jgi:hypothetical protein
MKKFISLAVAVAMVLALAIPVIAVVPGTANQNSKTSGSYTEAGYTVVAHGNGNSLAVSLLLDNVVVDTTAPLRLANKGTYTLEHGYWVFRVTVQGNKISALTAVNTYKCVDLCVDCGACDNCGVCECVDPIIVDLGFVGHYLHNGNVLTTSFYWQRLNEGDMIDWDAVEAAYAAWVAQGGLAPDTSNGWKSSGFAPLFFDDGAEVGHGDFSFAQLEGYYRSYFVATGYVLPYVCECECVIECAYGVCVPCADYCVEGGCDCVCDCAYNSASWSGRVNVQGSNNGIIVVTVNGADFRLTVNGQQAGTRTHVVEGYTIVVTSNSNNIVTAVVVTSATINAPVVINGVVSLTPGNQQ